MIATLPLLTLLILALGFYRRQNGWRELLLFASIPWALFVAFITEALTQIRFVTRTGVALSWLGFAILCLLWMQRAERTDRPVANLRQKSAPLDWTERVAPGAMILIAALVVLTGLTSAPNTWDAMEYHLPRVVEWINNRGVQFYPTIDWAQLCLSPFAEYVMLHLDLLYGSDRLIALVQWFSYVGCILAGSLIAKELGGTRYSQIIAAVFGATIPTVVLEASGPKTEVVAAYWIALAAYLLLHWRSSQSWPNTLAIAASMGLAVLTKGTSYVFLPCIALACVLTWDGAAIRRFLPRLPAIAALGAVICLPMWVRNYQYSGLPMGPPYFYAVGNVNRMYANAHVTPALALANVVRNIALHAGVPSDRINGLSTEAFSRVILALGVDPNDPGQIMSSQLGYVPRFAVRFHPRNAVLSEDPVHLLLLALAGVLVLLGPRRFEKPVRWFGPGLVGAFVLYCALLRWSQWSTRFQIPIFVLGAAFSAVVLTRAMPRWAVNIIAGLVLLLALPLAIANESRPLITRHGLRGSILTAPRDETYFFDAHRNIAASFIAAASAVRDSECRDIGIDANRLHFEYPMMAMLQQDHIRRKIRYMGVENSTVQYAQPNAPPVCTVICLDCLHAPKQIGEYSSDFPKMQSFGNVVLFSRLKH